MPTLTDPDADERYAPKADTQPGTTDMSEFEREFDTSGAPIAGNNLRGREDQAAQQGINDNSGGRSASAKDLENKEQTPPDRSGFSGRDDINEKLGQGYTGKGSTKSKGLSKLYSSNSKLKKRVAIAGAAAGGSAIGGVLLFMAMLPLKVEHIVSNLQGKYSATSENALGKETSNLFSDYVKNSIMPSLLNGTCKTTIDPKCVVVPGGTGKLKQLYAAWSKGRIENKLATKYGLIMGKDEHGFFINFKGENIGNQAQFARLRTDPYFSLFDLSGTKRVSKGEFRQATRDALKNATLWDKTYFRYKVVKLRATQFGLKNCVVVCNPLDKFSESYATKKLAAKLFLAQRVLGPLSESYSLLFQCMLSPTQCDTKLSPTSNLDPEKTSKFDQGLDRMLSDYMATHGPEKLAEIAAKAKDINDLGLKRYLAKEVASKIAESIGGKEIGAATGAAVSKAIPIAGWISLALSVHDFAEKIGPAARYISYAQNSRTAAALASTYSTVASEMKSGHMDPTILGSFADQLSTATPYYNATVNGVSPTLGFSSPLGNLLGTSYADAASSGNADTCDNNKPIPVGSLVCDEENFTNSGIVVNTINGFQNQPFMQAYLNATDTILAPLNFLNKLYTGVTSFFGGAAVNATCTVAPGCQATMNWLSGWAIKFFGWIYKQFIPNPFANLTPGRTTNMVGAGFDVMGNKSCKVDLGCAQVSNVAAAAITSQQLADEKYNFQRQPIFARLFSTSSSYSLLSRMSMAMPTNLLTATNNSVSAIVTNPLARFASVFSNIFAGDRAFAAPQPLADPFGVTQYGYLDSQIPSNPDAYWAANCQQYYNAQTGTLDSSQWFNAQSTDPNTGESVANTPNSCMLIDASIQTAGVMFDSSLIPADSNSSNAPTTSSPGVYKDPLRGLKNVVPARIDGGVDYNAGDGPVYPIGNATVVGVRTGAASHWPGDPGSYILYQLTDGPAAGKFAYMAEDCTPTVTAGQTVTVDTPICNYHYKGTAMELGWGDGKYDYATNDYSSHGGGSYASNTGLNFSQFMVSVGGPAGAVQGAKSTVPMPPGWPIW